MRILVLGASGQVAMALGQLRAVDSEIICVGRPQLDLTQTASIAQTIAQHDPDAVINAAAYTAVDRAESEVDAAFAVNAHGAGLAAEAAAKAGAAFIHISSDYVFDGAKPTPWVEDDLPNPLSAYGRSKLAGEKSVMAAHPNAVILRTSWVYSAGGSNFVRTMLRLAVEGRPLRVVDDQHGAPTSAMVIADAIMAILRRMQGRRLAGKGVFHLACRGEVSWCGFARAIMAASAARSGPQTEIAAITTDEYPTPARRPANSRLDCGRIARTFGITLPRWQDALEPVMDTLVRPASLLR